MNQTTGIIAGGILIIVFAAVLYTVSGSAPRSTALATKNDNFQVESPEITTEIASTSVTAVPEKSPVTVASEPEKQVAAVALTKTNPNPMITLHTSMGDITLKLYKEDTPNTVENFIKLASSGFYDGVKFHRVIKGFMIQAGDPNSKDDSKMESWGAGGPGYKFPDEIASNSAMQKGYKHGILAMANSGPNTNGSQFFIMAADYPLPPLYVIFGEVTSGLDVVDAIDAVKTDGSARNGGNDRPLTPVVINSATVAK